MIAKDTITSLQQIQTAVASSNTRPLLPVEPALSNRFDRLCGYGDFGQQSGPNSAQRAASLPGAQAARRLIVERYMTHRGPTNWISFTNIGAWGHQVIRRSAITQFIQSGNAHSAAAYFHKLTMPFGDFGIPRAIAGTCAVGGIVEQFLLLIVPISV